MQAFTEGNQYLPVLGSFQQSGLFHSLYSNRLRLFTLPVELNDLVSSSLAGVLLMPMHWVCVVSARTFNTVLCLHVYFCSELSQTANTSSRVARICLQARQLSSSIMPHCLIEVCWCREEVIGRSEGESDSQWLHVSKGWPADCFLCSASNHLDQAHC